MSAMGRDPYALEIARAWAAYCRKFPFVPFYQFAVAATPAGTWLPTRFAQNSRRRCE